MAECNHVFIGKVDGVHCTKCSLHMSASEYVRYLTPEEKPKRQQRKRRNLMNEKKQDVTASLLQEL